MKKLIFIIVILCSTTGLISQWISQPCPTTKDILTSLQFVNSNTAYAAGWDEAIIKTTNSGANWFVLNEVIDGYDLNAVCFINENTGFIVGGNSTQNYHGVIYKTTNGGVNWATNFVDSICYRCIWFINANTGYLGGWPRHSPFPALWKTTNGGNNWTSLDVTGLFGLDDFHFLDVNTGWAVGYGSSGGGLVLKTTNGGTNWFIVSNQVVSSTYYSVFFINVNTGWITGIQTAPRRGLLRKTTNGGINWVQQDNLNYNELYRTFFINENTGWVCGDGPAIQKTTNGGSNWFRQFSDNLAWGVDIFMKNADTGWVVGSGGIRKTTNSGNLSVSGNIRYSDNNLSATGGYVKAIKLDRNTGNIITYDSAQIQPNGSYFLTHVPQDSVDIGVYPNSTSQNDWVMTYYPSTINWQRATTIYPTGNLTNINVGVFRLFPITANNYVNGKIMRNNPIGDLKDAILYVKVGSSIVRYATSDNNGVYHLSSLPTGTLKIWVNRWGFDDDSISVSVTPTSNIDSINFILNKIYIGIRQIGSVIPSDYKLFQNYPNPFNPATIIKFQIKDSRHDGSSTNVKLVVFDILGKEVATLVNGNYKPGMYEATFDGGSLPSGIYFYRLIAGDFNETKKMLMIK
jgi:photosystem II stability/assembly factor-like uncharacterized protein